MASKWSLNERTARKLDKAASAAVKDALDTMDALKAAEEGGKGTDASADDPRKIGCRRDKRFSENFMRVFQNTRIDRNSNPG